MNMIITNRKKSSLIIDLVISTILFTQTQACEPAEDVFYPRASGCLVTTDNNELLMVQDTNNQWTFPAGRRSKIFESGMSIASRETEEEAGVTVDEIIVELVCVDGGYFNIGFWGFAGYCCTPTDEGEIPSPDGNEVVDAAYLNETVIESFEDSDLRFPDQKEFLLQVVRGEYC